MIKSNSYKQESAFADREPLDLAVRVAKFYLSLFPAWPPAYNTERVPLQRAQMEYDDENTEGFRRCLEVLAVGKIDFRGKRVLDLGSGYGGRTVRFKELGADIAVGLEVRADMAQEGSAFSRQRSAEVGFVAGVGEKLPFRNDCFDIITAYDVFEHVERLEPVVEECWRVLKPGGVLYSVFPPFFHPFGGSHLHGFVSRAPAPNLLFSNETLMKAVKQILDERGGDFHPRELRPADKLWGLNGATIRSFRKILSNKTFFQVHIVYAPMLSPMKKKWNPWKMKYYAFLFRPLTRIPFVNEVFVDRLVCALTK
jgi:SAM-dependent methyltransferase